MALRSCARWFVITCCFATFQANLAYAQEQPSAPGKPPAPAKASAPAKPPPPPPPPPKPMMETIHVCARPGRLEKIGQPRWSYDRKGKVVSRAEPEGMQVEFLYDPKAPLESVDKLPGADKNLRCPGDPRPAPAEPAPAPPESIQKLLSSPPRKKGDLPESVHLFRNSGQSFRDPNPQKTNLITNLLASILDDDKPMKPLLPNDLSVQAAKELYTRFGEKLTAAMAHQRVVAPHNVQEKFTEFQRTTPWKRFALVADRWVHESGVGTTDTVPSVILKQPLYEQVKASLDAQMANVKTRADAKAAYEKAYEGFPSWLEAIAPYFEDKPADPQAEATNITGAKQRTNTAQ